MDSAPPFLMGRSAAKQSVDRLLVQAKVDEPDQIKYAKYVEACTNVTFHDDQKGLSLAKIFDMKKALSLVCASEPHLPLSPERWRVFCRGVQCREGTHPRAAARTRRRRRRCRQDHGGPPVRRTSRSARMRCDDRRLEPPCEAATNRRPA